MAYLRFERFFFWARLMRGGAITLSCSVSPLASQLRLRPLNADWLAPGNSNVQSSTPLDSAFHLGLRRVGKASN
jgi:hypothetical protein